MKTKQELSAYKIWWVEFRAINGIVTLHDKKIFATHKNLVHAYKCNVYYEWFVCKDNAKEYLASKIEQFAKLDKQYEVRLCTDKQFGMRKYNEPIHFTAKQEQEMFIIG